MTAKQFEKELLRLRHKPGSEKEQLAVIKAFFEQVKQDLTQTKGEK